MEIKIGVIMNTKDDINTNRPVLVFYNDIEKKGNAHAKQSQSQKYSTIY
jgi:hypothetical protein